MFDIDKYSGMVSLFQDTIQKLSPQERTPEKIREILNAGEAIFIHVKAEFNDHNCETLARYFEQQFEIQQSVGSSIVSETHKPWLDSRKSEINFYYWKRFRKYLQEDIKLPPNVVRTLDGDTDSILDYVGDPTVERFQRRGMVVGHVQSGKTSNYSSLICKSADAGYRVIILLTGITNSLRRQTQDRIDHAFIGRRAEFGRRIQSIPIGAALYSEGELQLPVFGTTLDQDFNLRAATTFGVPIQSLEQPIIFTTKKNPSTLSNLLEWLRLFYPNGGIEHPLLLIDDEADNASINTKKNKGEVTRINEGIRAILKQFNRASYVAYTATPFANIFISPDSPDEMETQDLFPKDFIKVLDAPDNYVGPSRVFTENGDLADIMVKQPDDFHDILPVKHKNHTKLDHLPPSLEEAVLVFVLIRCIRFLTGKSDAHCTMMVNVSRFNTVQENVCGLIYQYLELVKDEITMYSRARNGFKNSDMLQKLASIYKQEFTNIDTDEPIPDWISIQNALKDAVATIKVQVINMKGGGIEYDKHKDRGLHVITVGGLALSRGLTLEGLCVSYILRNPSAYDTLMQMGRWFGYRPGYEHLCRLYIPDFARDYYEHITHATDELRDEINIMENQGRTPKEFGLKVREHPAAIRITAANKMSSAVRILVSLSFEKKHVEGHAVYTEKTISEANKTLVNDFLASLPEISDAVDIQRTKLFWSGIEQSSIRKLLTEFSFPSACKELHAKKNDTSLLVDYIDDHSTEMLEWDVCIPEILREDADIDTDILPGLSIRLRNRRSGGHIDSGKVLRVIKKSNRVASKQDASFGLRKSILQDKDLKADWQFNTQRENPLLIIHCFNAEVDGNNLGTFISLSVCLPGTNAPSTERKYMANEVWHQLNLFDNIEDDDSDEDLENYDEQ